MHIWLVKTMKYAAAMLILIISTYQLSVWHMSHQLQDDLQAQTNTLYVPAGQRACITLQDGTIVWLNAQSTLIYPSHFYGKERIVSITGEAFFEVSKDKEKPFIVTAQDAKIRVLGTKFNVYSYPDTKQIKTSLIEGAVQVFYKSKQVILRPNEESIAQDGKLTVGNIKILICCCGETAFTVLTMNAWSRLFANWNYIMMSQSILQIPNYKIFAIRVSFVKGME